MWQCVACGARSRAERRPPPCACGIEESWASGAALEVRRAGSRAVCAAELEAETRPRLSTGEADLDRVTGGGWPLGSSVLVWGSPGAGKSRLTMRWASRARVALVVALEMPLATTRDSAVSAGADPARLFLLDDAESWRGEAERVGAEVVVFDSVSAVYRPVWMVRELTSWAWASGGLAFCIVHRNARGRAYGGPALEHWADTTVDVAPRGRDSARVRVRKSRFMPRVSATVRLVK